MKNIYIKVSQGSLFDDNFYDPDTVGYEETEDMYSMLINDEIHRTYNDVEVLVEFSDDADDTVSVSVNPTDEEMCEGILNIAQRVCDHRAFWMLLTPKEQDLWRK